MFELQYPLKLCFSVVIVNEIFTLSNNCSQIYSAVLDTSKFRRYDDDTDSDEDDDERQRRRRERVDADDGVETDIAVNNEYEVEVHRECLDDAGEELREEARVEEPTDSIANKVVNVETANGVVNDSLADISDNITLDESSEKTSIRDELDSELKTEDTETEPLDVSSTADKSEDTNKSADLAVINTTPSFNKPELSTDDDFNASVENAKVDEPKQEDDIFKQDDSVSNSYSSFSRFNRRNRRGSESGESEANSSRKSSPDRAVGSCSGNEKEDSELESDSDSEDKECVDVLQSEKELVHAHKVSKTENSGSLKQSQESNHSSNLSDRSPSSPSSSSLDSDSEASSSSRQPSPKATSEHLSQILKNKPQSETSRSRSPVSSKAKSLSKNETSAYTELENTGKRADHYRDSRKGMKTNSPDRSLSGSREGSSYKTKRGYERSKSPSRIRSESNRHQEYGSKKHRTDSDNIKADPEFDAANYRDDKFSLKSSSHSDYGKSQRNEKLAKVRDRSLERSRNERGKSKEKRYTEGGIRHFHEISNMKKEFEKEEKNEFDRKFGSKYGNDLKGRGNFSKDRHVTTRKKSPSPEYRAKDVKGKYEKREKSESANKKNIGKHRKHTDDHRSEKETLSKKKSGDSKQHEVIRRQKSSDKSEKRRSIEEKLKNVVSMSSESDSEDSDKSVSSPSDSSSDSEAETWRDKKQGGSRKSIDIELERKRRKLKEQQEKEQQEKSNDKGRDQSYERERGERGRFGKIENERDGRRDRNYGGSHYSRHRNRITEDFKKVRGEESNSRQKYYHKKNMVFYEEEPVYKKKFDELSSDSDSDKKRKSLTSVIRNEKGKKSDISHVVDLKVSNQRTGDKSEKSKKDRLVIEVKKSSDDERARDKETKKKHKVKKHKKRRHSNYSSEEDLDEKGDHRPTLKQVVNVTFDGKGMLLSC